MTYTTLKNLIDDIRSKVSSHVMVKTVHFGELSDLPTPKDMLGIEYPYVFFQIESIPVFKKYTTVVFNMIIMEQCNDTEESILNCQSDMLDIGKDILANYTVVNSETEYSTEDTEWSFIPFVESHPDRVAGVSTNLTFSIQQPLTNCSNPIPQV